MRVSNTTRAWKWAATGLAALPLVLIGQEWNLSPSYAGQAFALQVTRTRQPPVTLAVAGPAPASGGQREDYLPNAAVDPGMMAFELYAVTSGAARRNHSQASVSWLDAWLGAHHLTAERVSAEAQAAAEFLNVPTSGQSTLTALNLDGAPVAVTRGVNQTIPLPDGQLILNEQSGSSSRQIGTLTVTAIDFIVNGAGRLMVASATAKVINMPALNSGPW